MLYEFIEKLVALPPPRSHLMRWAVVIVSNSPYGRDITFRPEINKGFQFAISEEGEEKTQAFKNYPWSKMLGSYGSELEHDSRTCKNGKRAILNRAFFFFEN